jgi:hypothetical protein
LLKEIVRQSPSRSLSVMAMSAASREM